MATYDVAERSAIVTETGSGIGRAVAHLLAENGASVVVSDLDADAVDTVVEEISQSGGTAIAHVGDVSDPDAASASVRLATEVAPLGIAVNNAGIGGASATTGDYPLDSWHKVMDVNLNGVLYGMQAQLPAMVEAGRGSIINIASILGSVGFAQASAYVAAKHAVVGLTERRSRVRAAGSARQLSGSWLHPDASPRQESRRGHTRVPQGEARDRPIGHLGGGREPRGVPRLRRRFVHHRVVPPGRRGLHGAVAPRGRHRSPREDLEHAFIGLGSLGIGYHP